ncbi:MAG: tyrosine-type recombinase/integrase [Immundisolibacter sp.]|uniref:tyrosine-type recombinase/integrase n=1 Tax=Immundisolibacter sp. TaxID=1934948 RepID=UPI001988BD5C|nr:site-specific integrase [Immundisolibacter sp.]MBC7162931.1 tyrosine-type recombinase/integrase [Immundisolibacter sp.]
MARFTTKQIDALRPTDKQFELSEPGGLRVRVYPSGRVVFVLRYRDPAGKQRVVTLGTYPAMGLAQARVELAKALAARGTGTDPAEARAQQRQESRRRAQGRIQAPTVADIAEQYLNDLAARVQRQERSAASLYEARRLIAKHVLPALGTERADEVTRQDVRAVLRKVATASTPTMADKVLVVLRAMMNSALEDDTIAANPAGRIKKTVGRTSRDRVLADAEIAALWTELDRRQEEPLSWAMKLALVTAQRRGSVVTARWEDIDADQRLWTIPRGSIKGRRAAHVVPLSSLAVEVIDDLRARTGGLPVLFPGQQMDQSPHPRSLSRYAQAVMQAAGIADARTHDLRRTAATLMARAGVSTADIGGVLAHADGSVTRVYDRFDRIPERTVALERLADALRHACRLPGGRTADVIHLRRGK